MLDYPSNQDLTSVPCDDLTGLDLDSDKESDSDADSDDVKEVYPSVFKGKHNFQYIGNSVSMDYRVSGMHVCLYVCMFVCLYACNSLLVLNVYFVTLLSR